MRYLASLLPFVAVLLRTATSQEPYRSSPAWITLDDGDSATSSKYPDDPPLDRDYVHDDLQPLDGFEWSTPKPEALSKTISQGGDKGAVPEQKSSQLECRTTGPRKAAWFSDTAPQGTSCVFGVDPRDEGGYCIHDDPTKHGPNGWCWTKADRSEWGSCNDACPLTGQDRILLRSIEETGQSLKALVSTLARQLGGGVVPDSAALAGAARAETPEGAAPPPPAATLVQAPPPSAATLVQAPGGGEAAAAANTPGWPQAPQMPVKTDLKDLLRDLMATQGH